MMSLALRSYPFSKREPRFKTLLIELGLRLNPFDAKLMRDNNLFKSLGATSVAAFEARGVRLVFNPFRFGPLAQII